MNVIGTFLSPAGPTWAVDFADLDEQLRFLRKMVSGPVVRMPNGQYIGNYRAEPIIRELALTIIRDKTGGARQKDKKGQALSIGQWVQDNIYYVHELPERFQTALETLRLKAGDCDDSAQLTCALLESVGIQSQFCCMQIDFVWKHIFPCALLPNGALLPLDTTMDYSVDTVVNPPAWSESKGKRVKIKLA